MKTSFSLLLSLFLCFLSSVLLILAFPKTDFWPLAAIGLVPLLLTLDHKNYFQSFALAYGTGVLFFAGTLYWFIHVTFLGAALLILYLSLYFGFWGLGVCYISSRNILNKIFFLPSWWVVLEYIRGHFLTGFDWASLGYSQYKNLIFIQIADMTGVFGVSFLIVMVNLVTKDLIQERVLSAPLKKSLGIAAGLIVLTLAYGGDKYTGIAIESDTPRLKVAVIQGNIPQEEKWVKVYWPGIMKKHLALSREALSKSPDLIIWPETSLPGNLWEDKIFLSQLQPFVKEIKIPLLAGTVINDGGQYFNSALLLSSDGELAGRYDKVHLVPFGEYIPLRRYFPFLSNIVPIGDFTPGKEYTLFPFKEKDALTTNYFSVLICFEDTIADLARRQTQEGSQLFINITNDAWFQDTKAPFMHLQNAVFRAVENRRSLVRSANTGFSGFIDARGKVADYVNSPHKATYVAGYALADVYWRKEKTFYTRYGDIFVLLSFITFFLILLKNFKNKFSIIRLFKVK